MENCILKTFEHLRGFFNLYIITFSSFAVIELIRYINKEYYNKETPLNFLNNVIYTEYFSLIYGILFFAFILVIALMFYQLHSLALHISSLKNFDELKNIFRYFPWIASPFHKQIISLIIFVILTIAGIFYTLSLSMAHIFIKAPDGKEFLFRLTGYFDFGVFIITLSLTIYVFLTILKIRKFLY